MHITKGHFGDVGVLEAEVETLRGIEPPDPYQVLVRIPNGMECTGPSEEGDTALAKHIRSNGAIKFETKNSHSTLAFVRHGSDFRESTSRRRRESLRL